MQSLFSVYCGKNNKAFDIKFGILFTFGKKMSIQESEYPAYFANYVQIALSDRSLSEELEHSFSAQMAFLSTIPESKKNFTYAEGKWTIGQVLQHLIDVELIMAHRAFRISREKDANLPGFDQVTYVQSAQTNKTIAELLEELKMARNVTIMNFKHLNDETLSQKGLVSGLSLIHI